MGYSPRSINLTNFPMQCADLPWTETERLDTLASYGILDTPREQDFDDVVQLVGQLLGVPIAAVNLIADGRQWFKSEIGLGVREMPLDDSICKFALLQEDGMVVPDTRDDARFNCNPLVTGAPGLRFYAGELLKTSNGIPLGTLCALDMHPRPQGLSEEQAFALKTLARQVMSQIELRRVLKRQDALLAEQQRTADKLRMADKNKDEFLATLAHELRNPLAPITSASALLSFTKDPDAIRKASAVIARQAKHITGLVDDLLDVSRVAQGKITLESTPVDLRVVAADALEQTKPLVERQKHRLDVHLPDEPAIASGDHKRLVQVLTNLLSNAAKYTPKGGEIVLTVAAAEDQLLVSVSDNGIGMGPELLANAFDLFAQASDSLHQSEGGLGIGLALVKNLVQLHGGTIEAHSAGPGQGSRFDVLLPRCSAD